ncbi:hypothetical protein PR003_g5372 [Phytophthora rubi]|uniref:Uncharacterized protein n=1 Tax=Phytophthora rubi TaxID=129364 RepID=A0A6A4FSL3_9STRA|nr:hypothetical protein PR002_g5023 [Phytophthora rubi]KAE9044788.1 hypothetical protein PR001_g5230 [Phytophthora rubi]KAE9350428.1 hypothetical protein PR003_g5372 [Phytophthora rubi]
MKNINSWTEPEIDILVQTWSEVEAKYPLLRCPRGMGTLQAKIYALFSKRSSFSRSTIAVQNAQQHIRNFVLFVDQYDKDRQRDGGRLWYELTVNERERRRGLVPRRVRGLATALGRDAFAKLLKMERVQRWLGGGSSEGVNEQEQEAEAEAVPANSSFLSPRPHSPQPKPATTSLEGASAFLSEANVPSTEHETGKIEDDFHIPEPHCSDGSTCSLHSKSGDEGSPMSTASTASQGAPSNPFTLSSAAKSQGKAKRVLTGPEVQSQLKHRDCNILLENMMELNNTKMRRAVSKLRADIEEEIQRTSEMLLSIIRQQFKDPKSSGDVAFVTKVLDMQRQQVHDRFDRFEEKRAKDEAECRALVGQRFA